MKRVLVVVAHADDEVLGCGGAILRHVECGDDVHVVYMTDGVGARGGDLSVEAACRVESRNRALEILGVENSYAFDFPDNKMDSVPLLDVIQPLEKILKEVRPDTVYTHHCGDLNVDHRLTNQAVITACRPLPGSSIRNILTFEVMSSTEWNCSGFMDFIPNVYIDIADYLRRKCDALEAYDLEMRPAPHSRCIDHVKHLARHRGYSVGLSAAEAFIAVREIIN
ncbi:PIG-L deacetylase family protein [Castellaniella sp.]|uniref:PIG-L deacetylase family protein n=1 Tax=Castellaniella sp. TaxID=1955812 RepID=UPI003C767B9F